MNLNAGDLLRALGGGVAPALKPGAASSIAGAPTPDFASLLGRAQAGELSSGRALRIDDGLTGVEFTTDQMSRLADAADAADAAGATKLLAVIDGQGVVIDIPSRTIERVVSLSAGDAMRALPADVLVGVDSAVVVPQGGAGAVDEAIAGSGGAGLASFARAPSFGVENGSLLDRLASHRGVEGV